MFWVRIEIEIKFECRQRQVGPNWGDCDCTVCKLTVFHTVRTVHCAYTVHCVHCALCTLYTVRTLHSVCTMFTAHCVHFALQRGNVIRELSCTTVPSLTSPPFQIIHTDVVLWFIIYYIHSLENLRIRIGWFCIWCPGRRFANRFGRHIF